jgi:hypothetical protein
MMPGFGAYRTQFPSAPAPIGIQNTHSSQCTISTMHSPYQAPRATGEERDEAKWE